MIITRKHKHLLNGFGIGLAVTLIVVGGASERFRRMPTLEQEREGCLGLFPKLELASLDFRFQQRNRFHWSSPPVHPDIVLIAMDGQSFKSSDDLNQWPWPRTAYAKVIDALAGAGASAIGLDVDLSSPSGLSPAHDAALAESLKRAGNVAMVSVVNISRDQYVEAVGYDTPIPALAQACKAYGLTYIEPDRDAVFRKILLKVPLPNHDELIPAFSLRMLQIAKQRPVLESPDFSMTHLGIPQSRFLLNFCPQGDFPTYSFYQIHDGLMANLAEKVKGKMVLIGATAPILKDLIPTPISPLLPGVEYHANAMNTALTGAYIWRYPAWMEYACTILIGVLATTLMMQLPALTGSVMFVGTLLGYFLLALLLFMAKNMWLPVITPLVSGMGAFTSLLIFRYATEGREKKKIRQMFSRYVSQQVVEEILKNPDQVLVSKRLPVTVLFSDIRNFTTISEKLTAEKVVEQLNEYFGEMVDAIMLYGGTLDKFIGDAVMAVFGSPIPRPDDAYRAVQAALEMQKRLEVLRQKWAAEGKEAFNIGIGINTGEAIVGNIGSTQKMEYTVIGDTVNVASRLESLTKEHHAKILIGEGVFEQVKDHFETRRIGEVTVKGKTQAVGIYEVLQAH